jgi:NitT/TauT family transport system ATP-binding protein
MAVGSDRGTLTLGPDRFFDGRVFDPAKIDEYIAGFSR